MGAGILNIVVGRVPPLSARGGTRRSHPPDGIAGGSRNLPPRRTHPQLRHLRPRHLRQPARTRFRPRRRSIRTGAQDDYYFVIETKSTNNLDAPRALTESERIKIQCTLKHFEALRIEAKLDYLPYKAPVKDFKGDFKEKLPV